MKLYSLCSSSKGNCTYIGDGKTGILVDAGLGIRNYINSLSLAGIDPKGVQAIFVTHEHSDHISGLKKIAERFSLPVYGSRGTLLEILKKNAVGEDTVLYEINKKAAAIGDFEVAAFHTPHDSAESLGYTVTDGRKKVSVCTDLGHVTEEVHQALLGSSFVLLESNYDEKMLFMGKYPYFLKERIASNNGHLSNEACSRQLQCLIESGVEHFLLGHLSEENNLPDLALQHSVAHLTMLGLQISSDYTLDIAPRRNIGKVVEIC